MSNEWGQPKQRETPSERYWWEHRQSIIRRDMYGSLLAPSAVPIPAPTSPPPNPQPDKLLLLLEI